VRTIYQTLALLVLFSVAACSGAGSSNSAVPAGSMSAQAPAQTQSRALQKHTKPGAGGYTLFGDGILVHPGFNSPTAAQASYSADGAYGGVDFAFPAGATYSQLQNLSADYQFTIGSCGDGAPRFVVTLTNGTATGNATFYFGPPPNFTLCPPNVWSNTGNLASLPHTVDDSQLPGGTFYDPYTTSQTKFGNYAITDVFVVVDGFSAFRTVQWDNVGVTIGSDNETYTFESADSCKDGGWQQFTSSPGPFKNQGDCVSYFNNGK